MKQFIVVKVLKVIPVISFIEFVSKRAWKDSLEKTTFCYGYECLKKVQTRH